MNLFFVSNRFRRLKLPGAILLTLLQRTPVVRVAGQVETILVSSPVGQVLRSVVTAVASLGAMHSMAGATPLVPSTGTASGITVTVGTAVNVAYSVSGTQTPPQSWRVLGTFPPGLSFSGMTSQGTVNVQNLTLTGTPTTGGSYPVTITAYEFTNGGGTPSPDYHYTITVNGSSSTAPSISAQPQNQTVTAGGSANFSVTASGSPTPTYQWRKDGNALSGATNSSLALSNVQSTDAGTYTVVVTNSAGSVTSNGATLTVNAATSAPAFTQQPQSQSATAGGSVTFTAAASGSPTPTYQWRKDGSAISGATNASLALTNVQAGDAGIYTVVATNSAGSATSSGATLTVSAATSAPAFTQQPQSQTVVAGATVSFTVAASGSPTPTYQWRKDGVALTNGGAVSGATTATLTLTNVAAGNAGNYTVVASNSAGSATSSAATLALGTADNAGRIINMSVLTSINANEDFTFGFVVDGGTGTKPILMRAMGPSLAAFGVANPLSDPFVEFYNGSTRAAQNNDWSADAGVQAAVTTTQAFGFASPTSKDAALVADVSNSGLHSIKISGVNGASGAVIAELYDATAKGTFTAASPRLINVSLIKNVGSSTTLGFVIDGSTSVRVLIRAVGPTLAATFSMTGTIPDPQMSLVPLGQSTAIATNDNWGGGSDLVVAMDTVHAFQFASANSKDAAIVQTLPPGGYTVEVKPATGTATGTALIEVYEVR